MTKDVAIKKTNTDTIKKLMVELPDYNDKDNALLSTQKIYKPFSINIIANQQALLVLAQACLKAAVNDEKTLNLDIPAPNGDDVLKFGIGKIIKDNSLVYKPRKIDGEMHTHVHPSQLKGRFQIIIFLCITGLVLASILVGLWTMGDWLFDWLRYI